MALTMRFAKMEGSTSSETLVTIPQGIHESGIITQVLSISETGAYRLYLSGKDENQADFTLEIPIAVGTTWYEGIGQFWPMLLLIVAAFFSIFLENFDYPIYLNRGALS
jgi:hypothetical protein